MKRTLIKIVALGFCVLLVFCFSSCALKEEIEKYIENKKLMNDGWDLDHDGAISEEEKAMKSNCEEFEQFFGIKYDPRASAHMNCGCEFEGKFTVEDSYRDECEHDFQFVKTVPATCNTSQYDEYKCVKEGCNTTKKSYYGETDEQSHSFVDEIVEAECFYPGYKRQKCEVCGEYSPEEEIIPAEGHNFVNGECTKCGAVG